MFQKSPNLVTLLTHDLTLSLSRTKKYHHREVMKLQSASAHI